MAPLGFSNICSIFALSNQILAFYLRDHILQKEGPCNDRKHLHVSCPCQANQQQLSALLTRIRSYDCVS